MKLIFVLVLAALSLPFTGSTAFANERLGNVIRDSIRGEIRDNIRDNVRQDFCRRREDRNRNPDLCNTLEDLDRLRDSIRRGRNRIRAIDAILD